MPTAIWNAELDEGRRREASAVPLSIASQRGDRQWHRALRIGLVVAVVAHLLLLLLFRSTRIPPMPGSAAGPSTGDVRAAAGGGSGLEMVEVRLQSEPRKEVEEVPTPVPVEVVVAPEVPEVAIEEPAPAVTPTREGRGGAGEGGEQGTRTGTGSRSGQGEGGGGSGDEGESGAPMPTPRGMILPPSDRPRSVRGMELTVWVFVDEGGRVVPDSTRLDPPTPDRRYNDRLRRSAAEWVFEPARRAGRAVAAWYPYQIIL